MFTENFLNELLYNLPYLGLILLVVPTVGFFVMDKVMTRGIELKDALFSQDHPVGGFEFGGVMLLLFYLGFSAVEGPAHANPFMDYAAAIGMMGVTVALLAFVRGVLGKLVSGHNGGQDLNHEIFEQHNWAAACLSLALMMGVVNGVTEENVLGTTPFFDLSVASLVTLMGLSTVLLYALIIMRGRSFMDMMFTKDNPAAGVSLLGFAIAANLISHEAAFVVREAKLSLGASVMSVLVGSTVLIVALIVLRFGIEWLIGKLFKVSVNKEIFDDHNVGAGFIDAGVMIGSAIILTGVLI